MPAAGWPGGLFGRRDSLLIVLTCHAGLPATAIECLQRSDAVYDGTCVVITAGNRQARLDPEVEDPRTCPVAIYLRWARLLAFDDLQHHSYRAMAKSLQDTAPIRVDTVESYLRLPAVMDSFDGPLIPAINRWGHLGVARGPRDARVGMSSRAIGLTVDAHLSGEPIRRSARVPGYLEDTPPRPVPEIPEPTLAPIDADRGFAARRNALARLADLEDDFAEIDERTAALQARMDALLTVFGED